MSRRDGTQKLSQPSLSSAGVGSTTIAMSSTTSKLLFNASSLKDLLGVKRENEKKSSTWKATKSKAQESSTVKKRKKERQAHREIFKAILKQETGVFSQVTRKGKSGRIKMLLRKKWVGIPFDYSEDNYHRVKQIRKSVNNMLAYASKIGIAVDDSSILDKKIKMLFSKLHDIEANIYDAIKCYSLEEDAPSAIPATDAALVVSYCNIEITEMLLNSICSRCKLYKQEDEFLAQGIEERATDQSIDKSGDALSINITSDGSVVKAAALSHNREDSAAIEAGVQLDDSKVAAENMIDVDKFVKAIVAVCRRQLLTTILAERRGLLEMKRLNHYGTATHSLVAGASSAGSRVIGGDDVVQAGPVLRSQSAQERRNETLLQEQGVLSSVPVDNAVAIDELKIGEQSMASLSVAEEIQNDESNVIETSRWDKDPSEISVKLDESSAAFYSQVSTNVSSAKSHSLPPLKLQLARQKEDRKRALQRAGYDSSFARATPRCLIGNGLSQPTRHISVNQILDPMEQLKSMQGVISTVEALRLELQIAQAGLKQLDTTMDEEIVWVAKNCPEATQSLFASRSIVGDSSGALTLSNRSKNRCRQIALSNFCLTWQGYMQTTLQWTMQRWRRSIIFDKLEKISTSFAATKAIEIMNEIYCEALCRQYLRVWKVWLSKVQSPALIERTAAVVEIQRIVRGKLGKNRLQRHRLMRMVTRIQCMYRRFKARRILAIKRAKALKKRRMWAATKIRLFLHMVVDIKKAKRILLEKKKEKAAGLLQKLHRGALGRQKYREVKHQREREMERLRRQREAEELMRQRLAAEKAEEERKEREEMELILKRRQAAEEAEEAERKAALLREQAPQRKNLISQLFGQSTKGPNTSSNDVSMSSMTMASVNNSELSEPDKTDKKKSNRGFFGFGMSTKSDPAAGPATAKVPSPKPPSPLGPSLAAINSNGFDGQYHDFSLPDIDERGEQAAPPRSAVAGSKPQSRIQSAAAEHTNISALNSNPFETNIDEIESAAVLNKPASASTRPGSMSFKDPAAAASSSRFGSPAKTPVPQSAGWSVKSPFAKPSVEFEDPFPAGPSRPDTKQGMQEGLADRENETPSDKFDLDAGERVNAISRASGRGDSAGQQMAAQSSFDNDMAATAPDGSLGAPLLVDVDRSQSPQKSRPGSTSSRLMSWLRSGKGESAPGTPMQQQQQQQQQTQEQTGVAGETPLEPAATEGEATNRPPSSPVRAISNLLSSVKLPPVMSGIFKGRSGAESPEAGAAGSRPTSNQKPREPLTPELAALKIQLCARRRQARKRVARRRQEVKAKQSIIAKVILWAVVSIQKVARGRRGRKRMVAVRVAVQKEREKKRQKAAIQIQRMARGMIARRKFGKGKRPKKKKSKSTKKAKAKARTEDDDDADDEDEGKGFNKEQMDEIDQKLRRIEEMERSMAVKERRMLEAAKQAEEQAAAMAATLKLLEEKAQKEAAEFAVRQQLLMMAAGDVTDRSEYRTMRSTGGNNTSRSPYPSAPPTARNHNDPIPPNARRIEYDGEVWAELWDLDQNLPYWYCEATKASQWHQPGVDADSGYESGGAATDYSSDYYSSGGEYTDSEYGGQSEWQEYWDEQAQAKYWYNNATGEASWTKPSTVSSSTNSRLNSAQSTGQVGNTDEWVCYLDDATGQEYWYNSITGETSWA